MRITGNSSSINVFSSANSLSKASLRNSTAQKLADGTQRKDTAKISPMGKLNNMLENLVKQKDRIQEQRQALIGKTMEKGLDLRSIEPQLTAFDEQIKGIEKQMADLIAAQAEKVAQQTEEKAKTDAKNDKPKTEEEITAEKQNAVVKLSSDIKTADIISSTKNKVEGAAKVLKNEIAADKSKHTAIIEKYSPRYYTSTSEVISKKVAQLDMAEAKIKSLAKKLGSENVKDLKAVNENAQPQAAKAEEKNDEKLATKAESEKTAEKKAE